MVMTDDELRRHWREARTQDQTEIRVLADLNAVSAAKMEAYLREIGIDLPESATVIGRRRKFDRAAALELIRSGMTDKAVAERLGISASSVRNVRSESIEDGSYVQPLPAYKDTAAKRAAVAAKAARPGKKPDRWTVGRLSDILEQIAQHGPDARVEVQGSGQVTGVSCLSNYGSAQQAEIISVILRCEEGEAC